MKEEVDRIKKRLKDVNFAINHIEDMVADNRALLVKLIKQSNQVVEFLKQIELDADVEYEKDYGMEAPSLSFGKSDTITLSGKKAEDVRKLVDEFMKRKEDLQELEKELKKHKDKLTPGQIGES